MSKLYWWAKMGVLNSASPYMEEMVGFYDHVLTMSVLAFWLVVMLLYEMMVMNSFSANEKLHYEFLEMIWTGVPVVILILIAFPSIQMLYLLESEMETFLTIKCTGSQWFWSYEYINFKDAEFESYMVNESDLKPGMFRLLEVDNSMVVPIQTSIRVLVTSNDVIHSWTVPMLGVKSDAVPGRLSRVMILVSSPGVYYGQCSEICGTNHSFMPVKVESVNFPYFENWLSLF